MNLSATYKHIHVYTRIHINTRKHTMVHAGSMDASARTVSRTLQLCAGERGVQQAETATEQSHNDLLPELHCRAVLVSVKLSTTPLHCLWQAWHARRVRSLRCLHRPWHPPHACLQHATIVQAHNLQTFCTSTTKQRRHFIRVAQTPAGNRRQLVQS